MVNSCAPQVLTQINSTKLSHERLPSHDAMSRPCAVAQRRCANGPSDGRARHIGAAASAKVSRASCSYPAATRRTERRPPPLTISRGLQFEEFGVAPALVQQRGVRAHRLD